MKRIMILIAALFLVAPMFCNEVSFSLGPSYYCNGGYLHTDVEKSAAVNTFGATLSSSIDTDYIDFSVTSRIHENYKSINVALSPEYKLNDNLWLTSNIIYNFSNINYKKFTLNEHYAMVNIGLRVNTSFWLFNVSLDAYVGYCPVYLNFRNICETRFDINIDISKYVTVYFGMDSFQGFYGLFKFNTLFVKNTWGIEAHYTFSNGMTVFASYDYFCAHPEKAWDINNDVYNKSEGFVNLGIRYSLPF